MAEYYAVLSKAVSGLEASTAEARRTVYDKARNALIGQLKAIQPPLPAAEISRQRLELEEAIRKVERESAARSPTPSAAVAVIPPEVPSRPEVIRRPPPDNNGGASISSTPVQRPPAGTRPQANGDGMDDGRRGARIERAAPPQPYAPPRGHSEQASADGGPGLVPDYGSEPEASGQRWTEASYDEPRERSQANGRGRRRSGSGERSQPMETRARPSRLPGMLLLLLIVAMVGGLAALGWSQRAVIQDLLASFDSKGDEPALSTTATTADGPSATSTKVPDRLPGGQAGGGPVRVVDPAADQGGGGPAPVREAGQPADVAQAPPRVAALQPGALPPSGADFSAPQKATLYEEPRDTAAAASGVVAIDASVTWNYVANGQSGPEITANVEVPERGLKVMLTFRRNTDTTLPASHLVEVVVDTPADFPGKGIESVPRLVLKDSETATRGQPLIGATATITDGFFWIALSGVDTDVAANLAMLRDRGWFDLPLVYQTGQRAILTIGKGTTGKQAFDLALAAWAPASAGAAPATAPQ